MGTTFKELKRLTILGMPGVEDNGELTLVVEQAINDAIKTICSLIDLPEIFITDTTSADTVASTKSYTLTGGLGLTRPKDIFSIRVIDGTSSQDLIYVPHKEWDTKCPYPEGLTTFRPSHYTRVGNTIELYKIPDAAYNLSIRYNQWPAALTLDSDECPFSNLDMQVIFLSKDITNAYLSGGYFDFITKAGEYLKLGKAVIDREPNKRLVAQGFHSGEESYPRGQYWNDPFVKTVGG